MKCNKNLRENRKNRNCLSNQEVVMRNKVSGAIAIPKASWGCAPALPNRIRVVFLKQAAGSEIPVPCFWHTERVVRKATAFRDGANKTALPCETGTTNNYLVTVPEEQLQWISCCFTWNIALRETDFQHPAKGGSTPAFACQHAAIAPLPCPNLQPWRAWYNFVWIWKF